MSEGHVCIGYGCRECEAAMDLRDDEQEARGWHAIIEAARLHGEARYIERHGSCPHKEARVRAERQANRLAGEKAALYEALRAVTPMLSAVVGRGQDGPIEEALTKAEAALALARGESPSPAAPGEEP